MTEQQDAPLLSTEPDTEGHLRPFEAKIRKPHPTVQPEDEDVEGHKTTRLSDDEDVEGHKTTRLSDDEDVEGHKTTRLSDDEDVEGHKTTRLSDDEDVEGHRLPPGVAVEPSFDEDGLSEH